MKTRLLALLAVAVLANTAGAAEPKILFHARRASMAQPCQPVIERCSEAATLGQLYAPSGAGNYFVYLMAAHFDPVEGVQSIRFGIDYDPVTLSGVDIFSWSACSDSEMPATGWYQEAHSTNRLIWNVEHCPSDSIVVGGFFYLTCYTPSFLAIGQPAGDPATLRNCLGNDVNLPVTALGHVAFGATGGCNPCLIPCDPVAVRPTTWSGLKTLVGASP